MRYRSRCSHGFLFSIVACACALQPLPAHADDDANPTDSRLEDTASGEAWLLPTFVVAREPSEGSRRPRVDAALTSRAKQIDAVLSDAVQDFGLKLAVSESPVEDRELSDAEVVARASSSETSRWLIYPTIDARSGDAMFRMLVVAPGSKVAMVRIEPLKSGEVAVQPVVMLRDIIAARGHLSAELSRQRSDRPEPVNAFAVRARSAGRGTLALNAALFGGFVGYSVQRASGSDDPRLLYPLMALGTGLGLGASAIVAEEWDVGLGDAWYLSASAWWPALAGLSIARGRAVRDASTEYAVGVIGAASGLGLGTVALAFGGMGEGGALMTHSGGAYGAILGALTELAVRGTTEGRLPYKGLGWGAGAGVLLAGGLAPFAKTEPSRVLAIDLGAGVGGLAGAAVTSPFIFRRRTATGDRAFLLTTIGATLAGGVAGFWWSRHPSAPPSVHASYLPFAGPIGESVSADGRRELALGAGVMGTF